MRVWCPSSAKLWDFLHHSCGGLKTGRNWSQETCTSWQAPTRWVSGRSVRARHGAPNEIVCQKFASPSAGLWRNKSNYNKIIDFRLSQRCCWTFKPSGKEMSCKVVNIIDVSKHRNISSGSTRRWQRGTDDESSNVCRNVGDYKQTTRRHTLEDFNF